jgi:hypothetical protein
MLVLIPGHFLFWIPVLVYFDVDGEAISNMAIIIYLVVVIWAICDNDYSNLRRIGLDEYRKPLKHYKVNES